MSNHAKRRVVVVGIGAGGIHAAHSLVKAGIAVHVVTADHFGETTHDVAAGLFEPVGADPVDSIAAPNDVIQLDPVAATKFGIDAAKANPEWGTVERDVVLIGESTAEVDAPWADAVDGFGECEPPAGNHNYQYARSFKTVVVQPDHARRALLNELRNPDGTLAPQWTFEHRSCQGMNDVLQIAFEQGAEAIVIAAGNNAGMFHPAETIEPKIGLVAKQRYSNPIPLSVPVVIAATARIFPYDIAGNTVRTWGGAFLEEFSLAELRGKTLADFEPERREVENALGSIGIEIPETATWMFGSRPAHVLGPHLRIDSDHFLPVLHISGLSGSGATFGPAMGDLVTDIALKLLSVERIKT